MNCDRIRHLISEGYDRRLSPTERMQIVDHIQSCAGCARFERALHAGLDGISHLPEIAPSPRFWEAVHSRTAVATWVTPSRLVKQAAGMLGAAAAVALVAALTIFLLNTHGPAPTTSKQPGFAAGTTASPTVSAAASTFTQQVAQTPEATPVGTTPSGPPSIAAGATETNPAAATSTPSVASELPASPHVDETTAENTVVGYFHAINLQDYSTAYGFLGSALRQDQSLSDFTTGYATTKHDTLTITESNPDSSGKVVVAIYLEAQQADGSVRHYHGEYVVGYENGEIKIVDATVAEDLPATPTPTPASSPAACRADDLSATADYQGATGSMAGSIIFTNTGNQPCTLQSTASVMIRDSVGKEMATEQKTMSLDGTDKPVTIAPGQRASLFFVWSNWCPAGTPETSAASPVAGGMSFQIKLPKGQGSITAAAKRPDGTHDTLVPRCDAPGRSSTLSVGTFKVFPAP